MKSARDRALNIAIALAVLGMARAEAAPKGDQSTRFPEWDNNGAKFKRKHWIGPHGAEKRLTSAMAKK